VFFHKKETIHVVNVDEANPKFAQLLLEQFGGATGELTAALQYWVQSFHVENAGIRDSFKILPSKSLDTWRWWVK
jgi:Mn-containing catalase